MEKAARSTFEINNDIKSLNNAESVFLYSREEESRLEQDAPWKADPHYFQTVKVSAVALIKMYEIMGVMYGRVRDHTFWITDVAALPVQGTETRVNAGNEAFEYMVQFQMANEKAGKSDLLRGWYHSHPGYGCWLSGIDVNTQMHNQRHTDPYLAIVVDPNRTISAGKVEIGAFRTYPDGYTPPAGGDSEYQSIPMDKIEDFGAHANSYYPLKVEIYKTQTDEQLLDLLWNKYWVATLSQSNILSNRAYSTSQIKDLNAKIVSAGGKLSDSSADLKFRPIPPSSEEESLKSKSKAKKSVFAGVEMDSTALTGPVKDSAQIANEAKNGMTAQIVKDKLFNQSVQKPLSKEEVMEAVQGTRLQT